MPASASSVPDYLASLPDDRRRAIAAVRRVILANLDEGYEEGMQYGMIGYCVPHRVYPAGYHCNPKQPLPFAGLASQKSHMALYVMGVYQDPELEAWFREAWTGAGKKLDMGKSCVRVKKLEDVPLEVVGELIRRIPVSDFIARYEAVLASSGRGNAAQNSAAKKTPAKKTSKKVAKKAPAQRTSKKAGKKIGKTSGKATTTTASKKVAKKAAKGTTKREG